MYLINPFQFINGFWLELIEENFLDFYGVSSSLNIDKRHFGTVDIEIPFYRDSWQHTRFSLDTYVTVMKEAIELRKKIS